jgi:hypothetical protein
LHLYVWSNFLVPVPREFLMVGWYNSYSYSIGRSTCSTVGYRRS